MLKSPIFIPNIFWQNIQNKIIFDICQIQLILICIKYVTDQPNKWFLYVFFKSKNQEFDNKKHQKC